MRRRLPSEFLRGLVSSCSAFLPAPSNSRTLIVSQAYSLLSPLEGEVELLLAEKVWHGRVYGPTAAYSCLKISLSSRALLVGSFIAP